MHYMNLDETTENAVVCAGLFQTLQLFVLLWSRHCNCFVLLCFRHCSCSCCFVLAIAIVWTGLFQTLQWSPWLYSRYSVVCIVCSRHKDQDEMASSKVDAKVVLLGKSYAGKTCLVERYLKNRFIGEAVPYQNVWPLFGVILQEEEREREYVC